MERVRILDTEVDCLTRAEAAARLAGFLEDQRPHLVVTANPEIVLRAHREPEYREVLVGADLVVTDGFGLILASWFKGRPIPARITGVDLVGELLTIAEKAKSEVFFAVNKQGLVRFEEVRRAAMRHHPGLIIRGMDLWAGDPSSRERREESAGDKTAQVIICNFGAPGQEWWLRQNQDNFPAARVLVGVGGALDYLAARIRRAPRILRRIGLEWLWRLILQPRRLPRILQAVIVFPATVMTHRPHGD